MSVNLENPNTPQNVAGSLPPPSSSGQPTSEGRIPPAMIDSVVNQSTRTEEKTRAPLDPSRVGRLEETKYTYTELQIRKKPKSVFFNQNGSMMVFTTEWEGRIMSIWNTTTDRASHYRIITTEDSSKVTSVAFSPNSKLMVATFSNGYIKIWDDSTKLLLQEAKPDEHMTKGYLCPGVGVTKIPRLQNSVSITSVAFSPNGNMMLSTGANGTILIWEIDRNKIIFPNSLMRPEDQVFPAESCVKSVDKPIFLISAFQDTTQKTSPHKKQVNSAVFSPDSSKIVSGSDDGTIKIWDVSTGNLLQTLENTGKVTSVAFSPDGTKIISTSNEQAMKIWNASTGNLIETITSPMKVNSAVYSPDGTMIVSTCENGTVQFWNISNKLLEETGREVRMTPKSGIRSRASRIIQAIFSTRYPFNLL